MYEWIEYDHVKMLHLWNTGRNIYQQIFNIKIKRELKLYSISAKNKNWKDHKRGNE